MFHVLQQAEKAKENEEFMSKTFNDLQKRYGSFVFSACIWTSLCATLAIVRSCHIWFPISIGCKWNSLHSGLCVIFVVQGRRAHCWLFSTKETYWWTARQFSFEEEQNETLQKVNVTFSCRLLVLILWFPVLSPKPYEQLVDISIFQVEIHAA